MSYLVIDNCIKCKHTDCVSVCPVDCFYDVGDMLVINPNECIDCGVCEPECPVDAIVLEESLPEDEKMKWYAINEALSNNGEVITEKIDPFDDWVKWDGVSNKYEMFIEKSIPIMDITDD